MYDAKGRDLGGAKGSDYGRASAAKGYVIGVGSGQALVSAEHSTSFVQLKDGTAYVLFWIGADDASHVLEAVLSAPETAWKCYRAPLKMVTSAPA
ncbi:MAG: hypothetical protein WCJ30_07815 [Deltaproteobacteria bacterium]